MKIPQQELDLQKLGAANQMIHLKIEVVMMLAKMTLKIKQLAEVMRVMYEKEQRLDGQV